MLFKGAAAALVMFAPNQRLFKRPMSRGARDTLSAMLEWGCRHAGLFNNNQSMLMAEFCKHYNQIQFEAAEQEFDTEQYVKLLTGIAGAKGRPGIKPKTKEELLEYMTMAKLADSQWTHDNGMRRRNRVGDITQVADLYNWLVDYYLTNDFTIYDVNKIAEMGRSCKPEIVKREAQQITDPDKRNIPYLYAIVRGITSREEITKFRDSIKTNENNSKLARLAAIAVDAQTKVVHQMDPDQREKWEQDRAFVDLLRDLDI